MRPTVRHWTRCLRKAAEGKAITSALAQRARRKRTRHVDADEKRRWARRCCALPTDLSITPRRRIVHRPECILELRRDGDIHALAGWQPRHEPFVVERN